MDSGDNTRGNYNSIKIRTRLETRGEAARIAGLVFAIAGTLSIAGSIAAIGLADFPRLALFNTGLACFVWAGIMVIGWGATTGHLAVYRLVEHTSEEGIDQIGTVIDLERGTRRVIGDVLGDDLRWKRGEG